MPTPHSYARSDLQRIIPSYFDPPIAFASFIRKLYRWGFTRTPSRGTGCYELCSSTFSRFGSYSAAASVDSSDNTGGGPTFTTFNTQPQPLPQGMTQTNHPLAPNPLPMSHTDALAAILLHIHRSNYRRQPQSQPSINANSILQV